MRKSLSFIALALLIGTSLAACEEEEVVEVREVVRPVPAMRLKTPGEIADQWVPGRTKATREVDLSFEVAGKVIERDVFVGDEVKQGDVLARLDTRDYQNDLDAARAEEERASAQRDRVKSAAEKGAVSQQELTNAEAQFKAAAAEVRIAAKALEDTEIKAPFDGTVSFTYVEAFEDVREKQPVVRMVDTSRIEIVLSLPESDISYIPLVYDIRVKFDAFPELEVPAEIKEVGTEPTETTRTYPVTLIMDQPEGITILPGMAGRATGKVDWPEGQAPEEILVPVTAIFAPDPNQSYVWVIDETAGTVSRRAVTTGPLRSNGIPVTEGLDVGEWIAVAGVHYLQEGQKVEILQQEPEA